MTISTSNSEKMIKVEMTIGTGSDSVSTLSASEGTLSGNVWDGDASSITFTNTASKGGIRISSITITYYTGTYSVDNVSMRFGASISQSNWTALKNHEGWGITNYGVVLVKKATLTGYGENYNTVEKAYKGGKKVTVIDKTKDGTVAYADPYLPDGGTTYSFTARVSFSNETDYDELVCAAPFVVVGGTYYFLTEREFSVNTLASYYINNPTYMGGSNLSSKALTYLSTTH